MLRALLRRRTGARRVGGSHNRVELVLARLSNDEAAVDSVLDRLAERARPRQVGLERVVENAVRGIAAGNLTGKK